MHKYSNQILANVCNTAMNNTVWFNTQKRHENDIILENNHFNVPSFNLRDSIESCGFAL